MLVIVGCLTLNAVADDPMISDVVVRQRWPWSKLVDIDYVLTADPTQSVDVVVNAYNGSESLSLPSESFSGDLYGVPEGLHRIVWDPTVTAYTNNVVLTKFRVGLVQTPVPVYMIVDLTKVAGTDGQIEYIYPGDARLETYGRFTNVWFGVTNDSVYATDKLVLRRVHAGTFGMGDSAISTTLTKDFYASVFEVTQRQWELIKGTGVKPSFFNNSAYYASRPVELVSYDDIRGASNNVPSINWPSTENAVAANSFLGLLRNKTGLTKFDLPTEAQWEYLCRAGTTTYYSDGLGTPGNTTSNGQLNVLGRYKFDGGAVWSGSSWVYPSSSCSPTNGPATVGSYLPNNWGIYDTHGNLCELCLDWYGSSITGGSNPVGLVSGEKRILRSGSFFDDGTTCRSAFRYPYLPSGKYNNIGFRVVISLP